MYYVQCILYTYYIIHTLFYILYFNHIQYTYVIIIKIYNKYNTMNVYLYILYYILYNYKYKYLYKICHE